MLRPLRGYLSLSRKLFVAYIFVALFSASYASADLCVLKNGAYTLSSKYSLSDPNNFTVGTETARPCSDADAADGVSDNSIDLDFVVGEDINVDVVFEQDSSEQYRVEYFTYNLFYDTRYMSIGDESSGDCNPDPAGFFYNDMCEFIGVPCCGRGKGNDSVTPAVVNFKFNFFDDTWPVDGPNFVLDEISFANSFNTGDDLYTFLFDEGQPQPTDIGAQIGSNTCGLLSGESSSSAACDGVTLQDSLASKISIVAPPCYVGPPFTASVTCAGNAASCLANASDASNADADVSLSYSVSSQKCYESSACVTPSTMGACSGIASNASNMGVEFTNLAGVKQTNQTSGSYSDTIKVGDGTVKPSYSLKGVSISGACQSCSTTKTVTAPSSCSCGNPPEVTLTSNINKPFYQGSDIILTYNITFDSNDNPMNSIIKFYYADDINEIAVEYAVNVATDMSVSGNTGTLTVKIPNAFVTANVDIYFGLIVQGETGLTAAYPNDFSVVSGKLSAMQSSIISGDLIVPGTSFAFVSGSEPYPNQFPYLTGADENLLKIFFALNAQADVKLSIYNLDGALVREITAVPVGGINGVCSGENCNACSWSFGCRWNGTDSQGAKVPNGTYRFVLQADATAAFSGSVITREFGFHVYNENEAWAYAGITSADLNLTNGMLTIQGAECPYTDQYPVLGYGDPSISVEYNVYRTLISGIYSTTPNITSGESSYVGYAGGYGAGAYFYNMKCGVNPPKSVDSNYAAIATYFEDVNGVEISIEIPAINENAETTISTRIKMGWSLISFPFDNDSGNLIDYIDGDFGNNGNVSVIGLTEQGLIHATEIPMEKGKAYWINSLKEGDTEVSVTGKPTMSNEVVDVTGLRRGWNFIGNPFFTNIQWGDNVKIKCGSGNYVPVTDAEAQSFIYSDLYEYDNQGAGSYSTVSFGENMSPWKGYLAYITGAGCSLQMRIE